MYYICETCGIQYDKSVQPPVTCKICTEERQYVPIDGQSWITLEDMIQSEKYRNEITKVETGLYSIHTIPSFAIGQAAYVIQHNGFHLLWDCIAYLDQATIEKLHQIGGIDGIALSHPHYYSTQVEWANEFNIPIFIHEDDKEWITRPSEKIIYWSGERKELQPGLCLHRLGGHFKGGAVLEWTAGNNDKGILLTGDIIQVVKDQNWVSFMYSYPNLIPLPANKVQEISERVKTMKIDRIYNAFQGVIKSNAIQIVEKSANRYILALSGKWFET